MLGSDGLLPPGRHTLDEATFEATFVDGFPNSKTRGRLFTRWRRHREALASLIAIETQWIDGSYVTSKEDPGDIDLVTIIDGPTYDALPAPMQHMVEALLAGKRTKAVWGMDSFPIVRYPVGHPGHPLEVTNLATWHDFWSKVRTDDTATKGYVEVRP